MSNFSRKIIHPGTARRDERTRGPAQPGIESRDDPANGSGQSTLLAVVLTLLVTVALSTIALLIDQGSVLPLLIIPVIIWATNYGVRGGLIGGIAASAYTLAFIALVMGHYDTLPYVAVAAALFIGVGWVVGKLSDLRVELALKQRSLAHAHARLESELESKETLLAEVHHRIKNNLSTVLSLLTLQSQAATDSRVADALSDARNRIRSMVLLYDKLQQAHTITEAPADRYLRSLVKQVVSSLSHDGRIHVETDIAHFSLGPRPLSTLGIVVNELVTNSVKHAFPDGRPGTIFVSAQLDGDTVTITVADDGVGMPPAAESSSGFGLTLVHALTEQLGGRLTVDRSHGTKVTLRVEPALA
jgi:two-component sensor histidine kinase